MRATPTQQKIPHVTSSSSPKHGLVVGVGVQEPVQPSQTNVPATVTPGPGAAQVRSHDDPAF
eukprot:CAMPEP_0119422134 /NCGR_PEP_ID=MMETSP1335-20130426/27484_1 /TAXON_ID=259385 /ORGANISM="Chrysoculter rhomboideus, Strain RCC1486" /LENGTH=61 /DNA_ID=CAMNT_0007447573 /DNA_START=476 /DNA_END=661 /DNA_ORIENTATION=-